MPPALAIQDGSNCAVSQTEHAGNLSPVAMLWVVHPANITNLIFRKNCRVAITATQPCGMKCPNLAGVSHILRVGSALKMFRVDATADVTQVHHQHANRNRNTAVRNTPRSDMRIEGKVSNPDFSVAVRTYCTLPQPAPGFSF